MKIVICEDEQNFARLLQGRLQAILSSYEIPCEIHHCPSGTALLSFLSVDPATDLLFMDIQLEDCDGVELTRRLRREYPRLTIIFLTSLEDRIAEGYDVNAFSFLFKRDFEEKLPRLIHRFLEEIYRRRTLPLKDKGTLTLVDFCDIYYLEADNRSTLVHTASQTYTESTSIQNFSRLLPEDLFWEVYHALYVNIDHIRRVDTDCLELDNLVTLPVSRRKRKELMGAIMRRIQNR